MSLYRFSPIQTKEELLQAITYTHVACHTLAKQSFGHYVPVAGNIGIFCHFDEEFAFLTKLREEMTILSDNWNEKYYRLLEPITIPKNLDIPETTYTYLYIRKPDTEHSDVGDLDFYMKPAEYKNLKDSLQRGEKLLNASIFERPDLDLVKLSNTDVDACAFVGTNRMSEISKRNQTIATL